MPRNTDDQILLFDKKEENTDDQITNSWVTNKKKEQTRPKPHFISRKKNR